MLRRLRSALSLAALAAGLAVAASVLLPAALGYRRYVITSGSMTGTYDRGSIVYTKEVATASLRIGDVITYRPPAHAGPAGLVTHRVVEIGRDGHGGRVFRTKGDANRAPDPWRFRLWRATQPRVAFGVPDVGYALAALALRPLRLLVIGLPALLVAIATLSGLWRQAGAELARRKSAAPGGAR